jgi:hypothetical protein
MKPLTVEQQENLHRKIADEFRGAPLEEKDIEMLADTLHTAPMLKALGRIRASADAAAFGLINCDFGKEEERHAASRLQGVVHGSIDVIDTIIGFAAEKEVEDHEQPATAV